MSRVSERVLELDASPPVEDDREVRSLILAALERLRDGAPSLAMSYQAAAERGSQPTQRDGLAHSQTVPIGDGVFTSHYRSIPHLQRLYGDSRLSNSTLKSEVATGTPRPLRFTGPLNTKT